MPGPVAAAEQGLRGPSCSCWGRGRGGGGSGRLPRPRVPPQVHGQVLFTASHDGHLRLWDVRGLPRSRSRLFSNKVGCATAPLQPA